MMKFLKQMLLVQALLLLMPQLHNLNKLLNWIPLPLYLTNLTVSMIIKRTKTIVKGRHRLKGPELSEVEKDLENRAKVMRTEDLIMTTEVATRAIEGITKKIMVDKTTISMKALPRVRVLTMRK